jgi:hypothetical protein
VDEGLPTPALDDRVSVPPSLLWVYQDFIRLGSERSSGMSIGAIPVNSMFAYLRWTKTPRHLWDEAIEYWLALDQATLEFHNKKSKEALPKAKSAKPMRPGRNVIDREDIPQE